jgi:phytoene synthase
MIRFAGREESDPALDAHTDIVRIAARAYERDRYLAALLAPRPVKDDLVALAAFAGEIARIPTTASEPMVGTIRLQWWRDAIEAATADSETGHPIADAIGRALRRHGLAKEAFLQVIDASETGLGQTPLADDPALLGHLEQGEGALFALAARMLGADLAAARAAIAAAARCYGLARLLIELPVLFAQGRTLLPQTRLAAAGASIGDLASGRGAGSLGPEVRGLASLARTHLAEARAGAAAHGRALNAALLPCALVEPYLRVVEQGGAVAALAVRDLAPLTRVWRLWRAHLRGHF